MKIDKTFLIMIIVIIILLFINFISFNKINQLSGQFNRYENTIAALNDSIKVSVDGAITTYSKKAPEIYLNELINSEYFKSLSREQQEYYKELNKIKGLIAATNAQLRKQGEILGEILEGQNPGIISNDSISFVLGTELKFKETDTTKKLQWDAKVLLDRNLKFKMNYTYDVNIQTSFERQKDKSIVVTYKIDDPELQVTEMMNYIIPPEQRRTKFGQWIDKNKNWIRPVGGVLIFGAGAATGIILTK